MAEATARGGPRAAGLLHPGSMGSSVGAALTARGHRVTWASSGRSVATRRRAESDGLEDVETLDRMVASSDVILSVCPPESAIDVAREVSEAGFEGIYVDANAVSPATAAEMSRLVRRTGARYVDGGIIGPPARRAGTTRLYLSGADAPSVAEMFDGSPLSTIVLDGAVEAASAVKMAYAAWTKGTSALLAAIVALAEHEGVTEPLFGEWDRIGLVARADGLGNAAAKAWRWVGEMEEIAASFGAADLPSGFHEAAAEVYRRLARFKDDPNAPGGVELARWLLKPAESGSKAHGNA